MKRSEPKTTLLLALPAMGLVGVAALLSQPSSDGKLMVVSNQLSWQSLPASLLPGSISGSKAFAHHMVVRYPTPRWAGFLPYVSFKRLNCTASLTDKSGVSIPYAGRVGIDGIGQCENTVVYSDATLRAAKGPLLLRVRCQWSDGTPAFDLPARSWRYQKVERNK